MRLNPCSRGGARFRVRSGSSSAVVAAKALSRSPEDIFAGSLVGALWRLGRTRTHAMETEGLTRLVKGALDVSTFEELALPLGVVAVNLARGEGQVMSRGPLLPALLASSAIPGVFPPVLVDGQPMIDGGCWPISLWHRRPP